MTERSRRRRARHDIIMEILKTARGGEKKTQIMYKARLSFSQLEQYLNALKNGGFITEESGVWRTTQKGLHVIEACEICLSFTREV
jgi:predicted transcriptional regulator